MECKFCNKLCKNDNSLRNHQRLCKNNPDRQILPSNFTEYNNKVRLGLVQKKFSNQYIKARELGLPKPTVSEQTRLKLSKSGKGRKYSEEQRYNKSIAMKKAVEKYPDSYTKNNVVGRVKNIEYKGVKLKGSWEVLVAQWLDSNNIKWEHETKSFEYEWNGVRKYYPDFYLPELDLYIEVKGYERERDLAKWKVVPNLRVFKLNEINAIKNNTLAPLSALAHNELKP